MNSLATDMCNTMRALWRILSEDERLRHIFFIPCNSHGLQLLLKDILTIEPYQSLHHQAQSIAVAFKKAPKQFSILRNYQLKMYGRYRAFILSVITRWGTHHGLLKSVRLNKEALRAYTLDERCQIATDVRESIQNTGFWHLLDDLFELINFIHERQKMSESETSHVNKVLPRWIEIREKLQQLISSDSKTQELVSLFDSRANRQLLPIHFVAYYLNPQHLQHYPSQSEQNLILQFIERYGGPLARQQFLEF